MGASHLPVRHPGPRFPDAIGPFEVYHSVDGGRVLASQGGVLVAGNGADGSGAHS